MIYTVREGDTLYDISRRFEVPLGILEADNGILYPEDLVVGEDLVILPPAVTYTVTPGDTVFSVAERYGTTPRRIFRNNPALSGRGELFPGQTLVISRRDDERRGEIALGGFAYPFIEDGELRSVLPYLTYLSVFTHGIRQDGSLIAPDGGGRLVDAAREYGTTPLLMITSLGEDGNFSDVLVRRILTSPELSESVINSAVEAMTNGGYGGIDVDFEYVGALSAEYADFLSRLKTAMPQGAPLFVSLAPKTSSDMPGILYEGHDYRALGSAADFALMMTYEWGYTYGPPMAVAPIDKVRAVVEYGVGEIAPEKLFLGIPNYGYDFTLPYIKGESEATSLPNADAARLAAAKGARIEYDERSQAPYFRYFEGGAEHVVWFESARSVEAMGDLISEFSLAGGTVWNVMKFFPQMYLQLDSMFEIE